MTARIVLDTDAHTLICRWCGLPIYGPLVICGVGSALYLMAYHPLCNQELTQLIDTETEPPTLRPPYLQ
jgi:hypothetical protein